MTSPATIQIPRYLEIYIRTINSELDRFWSRFNLYAGIEILAVVALMLAFDKVQIHPHTARAANTVVCLWSITGSLFIWQSMEIQRRLIAAIVAAEANLPDDVGLFREALRSVSPSHFLMFRACFSFSVVCSIFWGGMIFLGPYS